MLLKRIGYLLPFAVIFVQCSTKKNTLPSRVYHNITARYNGYYYSNENLDEGVYKIEKAHKENFDKILPIYIYPTPEKVKSTFPDFDRAIKKSSLCIQKHAIKDKKGSEIPSSGKWIDNNWINIGISHFYKREFFSGIEAFEYVVRTYNKSNDKYTAMLWLIKANNEIGSVSSSEPIISLLKNNQNKLPYNIRNELPIVTADYYMRRGQNSEAVARLMEATRNDNLFFGISKKKRARYSFIIAQLAEESGDSKRAMLYYRKTIALKPTYELVFYSKIKLARMLDVKRSSSEKTKKDLLKMARDNKNSDYYDVVYYTLGEIEEKEKNTTQALRYYQKSVQTSTNNPNQKALSYLKLGEINFDLTNYQPAEAYYDSTIATLPIDHPQYNNILARKKTLETLVGYIKTINKEDSLQRIAKMSEVERNQFIDRLIKKQEQEEEKRLKELEAQKNLNAAGGGGFTGPQANIGFNDGKTSFYFYNANTVALGVAEFTKRWGYRKLEDNWRRASKAATIDEASPDKVDTVTSKGKDPVKLRAAYLKGLPFNDTLVRKSNNKIIKAYYLMGSIYKEELHNTKKTISSFEELNSRFPQNKYLLNTYYLLYRTYLDEKNQPKADYYKNKILEEFPDSEFALLIKNPEYSQEVNAKRSESENFYYLTYQSYSDLDYTKAYELAKEGVVKFGTKDYLPKFEFIKAVSYGKIKGVDTLEQNLKLVVARFPESEVTPLAKEILVAIRKQKNIEPILKDGGNLKQDTFVVSLETEHFIAVITPDDSKISGAFVTRVGAFNSTYYSDKKFNITNNLFGASKQLIIIKSFANAKDAVSYWENLQSDPELFKAEVKREEIELFPIQTDNLQVLYKKSNLASYKTFFEDNYKKLGSKN